MGLYAARVRRIIRQPYGEVKALGKLHQALHELGPPTVALGTIVQINDQRRDVGKALFAHLPPVNQPIHQAIARDGWHVTPQRKSSSEAGSRMPTGVTVAVASKSWSAA